MNRLVALSLLSAALCAAQNMLTSKETADGWVLLFDGKSLNGWQGRATSQPGTTGDWTVANGALVCGGTKASWLSGDATYSDFDLKLEFRGPEKVNSGVFLRSQKEGQPHITGYELQIWDYQPQGFLTGSLVNYLKATASAKVIGDQWNAYEIKADGDHFVISLNGKPVLDARDKAHASGVIGLQCQPDNRIEFRNLKIRPIKK